MNSNNNEKYDFFQTYKALNDHKIDNKHQEGTFLRNKLILEHYEAVQSLDNEDACFLLGKNLENYHKFMSNTDMYDNLLKSRLNEEQLNKCKEWRSSLNAENTKELDSNLPHQCNVDLQNLPENIWKKFGQLFVRKTIASTPTYEKKRPFQSTSSDSDISYNQLDDKPGCSFKTAREELQAQNPRKIGSGNSNSNSSTARKTLGMRRSCNKFVSPILAQGNEEQKPTETIEDERLKNIEPRMIELIKGEIMDIGTKVTWEDVAGLEFAKSVIQEAVIWPLLRPDIFTGLRRPPKGILLFGPPGTGKTLIGKCVASQSKSTFFSISASSLTSKWIGDGEKMVRALFAVARCHQPAVIFVDEIDSLLSQRSETEHECSRRLKTEFLVQLDGAATDNEERILLIGATNRPQELDEAARRRFVKRLYIPLPENEARLQLVSNLMMQQMNTLSVIDKEEIARLSQGFSGADIKTLCSEASLGPIRAIDISKIETIQANDVRPVSIEDFKSAFKRVRSSVASKDLDQYIQWNNIYGSGN